MAESDRPRRGVIASLLRSRIAWGVAGLLAGFAVGLLVSGKPWNLPPAWGDIPTWITAIATVGLLAGAIITAVYAVRAFRDQADMLKVQSNRLGLQERQFEDQRKINQKRDELFDKQLRESEQRAMIIERQQAEMIELEPGSTSREVPGLDPAADSRAWVADVINRSPRPIRNVASRIEAAPGAPAQEASLSGVYAEFPPSPWRLRARPTDR